jgi:hypothetical protein
MFVKQSGRFIPAMNDGAFLPFFGEIDIELAETTANLLDLNGLL